MKLSNWRRLRPAIVASLVSLTLSLLAAATALADGSGTNFP
jgi:hypothetical protein